MRKILVTGGAGFVGRHFIAHFLEQGDEVHCVDPIIKGTGGIDPKDGWPIFDPLDYKSFRFHKSDCREFFKKNFWTDFDYVFHLAAVVGGRMMIELNPLAVADDLSIDAEYWQWAKKATPTKTVSFSSSAAYPIRLQTKENHVLLKEDMIDFAKDIGVPDLSYGWAKLTCEFIAKLAYERHGLKSVTFRPFSGYGSDQDDTYPFPSICKRAMQNKDQSVLTVWGDGNQLRDFIHIDDCVRGVITMMDKIDNGDAINLSTGIGTAFKEFARMAARCCAYSPEIRGTSNTPSGVHARVGDASKQQSLGFKHKISLAEGIASAVQYYSERSMLPLIRRDKQEIAIE